MKPALVIVAQLVLGGVALAAPPGQRAFIGSAGVVTDENTLGLQLNGHLLVPLHTTTLDLGIGQAMTWHGHVGSFFAGLRQPWGGETYLRGGLAHFYTSSTTLFFSYPFSGLLGFAPGTAHLNGLELGLGVFGSNKRHKLLPKQLRKKARWVIDLALAAVHGAHQAHLITTLSLGTKFGLSKPR